MNIIAWIIFGIITGIVSAVLDPKEDNLFSAITLGVLGSLLGGFVGSLFFTTTTPFSLSALAAAIAGSAGLLITQRIAERNKQDV